MTTKKQLRDNFNRQREADKMFRGFPAIMGDASGVIDAGDGDVYVTLMANGQTLKIPNRRIGFGIKPIFIGTTNDDPGTLQVLSEWAAYDKPWPSSTVPHAPAQHSYGRFDPDWVEVERLLWLLVLPAASLGNFYVQIFGSGAIEFSGSLVTIDNRTMDLSTHVPAIGALYVILQFDNNGTITVKDGTPVTAKQYLTNADIPDADAGQERFCAIALYDSQKKLTRDIRPGHVNDFVDLRLAKMFVTSGGGDASDITYTPAVPADWLDCLDPGDVDIALDQLAERITDVENTPPGAGGLIWEIIAANQTAEVNHGYIANKGTLLTLLLPATAAVNDIVRISGMGAGGWIITQGAGQQIHFGAINTTAGVGGSLASVNRYDCIELICAVADLEFVVISSMGNITIV